MKIDVARLDEGGEKYTGTDPLEILEWDDSDALLHPASPVSYDLHAIITGQELLVRGLVSARFGGECSRCGGPLDIEISEPDFCELIPLPEDIQEVDLTPQIRESILLALPSHPVCRADCEGLCPRCGRQLAEGACGCNHSANQGWGALAELDVRLRESASKNRSS